MRLNNASKNIKYAITNYTIISLLRFLVRLVFVKSLPVELLGVNGLFSNILTVLSLAELGVGPAIVFSLYKPLAVKDIPTIKALMHLFKKAYIGIGILFIVLGLAITPWLEWFIKGDTRIEHLELYYFVFLLNAGVSYFYSYRRNLLAADQKQYIENKCQLYVQIVLSLLQIITLLFFQNYFLFILLMLAATLLENYWLSIIAIKMYPYLNEKDVIRLDSVTKQSIVKNVGAMIFHKIGGIVVFSTDNIILSKLVGLAAVGIYSNYFLIFNALNMFSQKFFGAITASVGNLVAVESQEKKVEIFSVIEFLTAWQAANLLVGTIVMINNFIVIWIGEAYTFNQDIVNAFCISIYITNMRKGVLTFRDAGGLYWQDRYKPVIESIINLAASIYLVYFYGVVGIFWGGIISSVLTCFWIEPFVLFRWGLKIPLKYYFESVFKYTLVTAVAVLLTNYLVHSMIIENSILGFFIGCGICLVITNLCWGIAFFNTDEMIYLKRQLQRRFTLG